MEEVRERRESAQRAPLRTERSAAALVAQYIHELSARHSGSRERRREEDAMHRASEIRDASAPAAVLSEAAQAPASPILCARRS